jgi:hypothetical protein
MKKFTTALVISLCISCFFSCTQKKDFSKKDFVIANGQMPALAAGSDGTIDLVYGIGDSIMFSESSDMGQSFSPSLVIDVVPGLYSYATRGPQIAVTKNGLVVTACTSKGNIISYYKTNGNWQKGSLINDIADVAPEGLMDLSADGNKAFAVWLDIRGNHKNKIVGARSDDGGKTWLRNQIIYTSPDSVVCGCCKPSVNVQGQKIYIMFRNWMNGNRDLYLIRSNDGGASFADAQKLGNGNWKLDACPMDGGGLAVNENGKVETVWRRKDTVYSDVPGARETGLGKGRNCTVATIENKFFYVWSDSSKIKLLKPDGNSEFLGNGMLPVLIPVNNNHIICAWENDKQIHAAVIQL